MNKLHLVLSIIIGVATVIGGVFYVDARFAKQDTMVERDVGLSADIQAVSDELAGNVKRWDRIYKQDRAKALQEQMWALERYYGVAQARQMGEYKRLKAERETILRELR